ncbi:MAG: S8 family serine peptidase [Bacteroidetes bacterium]|jgi:hypothetical protein|nr:S8 family serine peptidase [Bacteroidota bacterium]
MKNFLLIFLLAMISELAPAQNRIAVLLNDKNGTPYSFSNPSAYLTQHAIARRAQFSIALDSTDLPVNPAYISAIQNTGAMVLNTSKWLNAVTVDVSSAPNALAAINALPFVKQTKVVGRPGNNGHAVNKFSFVMQSLTERQHQLQRVASANSFYSYGNALNQIQMIDGDKLHDMGYRGNGKIIAMLDAGFFNADQMTVFDSLRAHNRIIDTYDFVDHQTNVYDDHTHGAMCFSIIGANDPGNLVGTAPEASFYLFRSEDANTENPIEEYNWATAAEAADSVGADIISSSLGYFVFDDPSLDHTYADLDGKTTPIAIAATIASRKGMVVVNSAGNEGNNFWHYIISPGDADSIITVGAVDSVEQYAFFSSTGPTADGRVKPTVAAQGMGTYVSNPYNNSVFSGNGTSFSCPVIAGMVACLWQSVPSATNIQIMGAIKQSASQYLNPDSLLGYGIPNFDSARMMLLSINNPNFGKGDFIENVFPNPFSQTLNVNFYAETNSKFTAEIFDMAGKRVTQKQGFFNPYMINSFQVQTSAFAKGVYMLRIVTDNAVYKRRIIKQ